MQARPRCVEVGLNSVVRVGFQPTFRKAIVSNVELSDRPCPTVRDAGEGNACAVQDPPPARTHIVFTGLHAGRPFCERRLLG